MLELELQDYYEIDLHRNGEMQVIGVGPRGEVVRSTYWWGGRGLKMQQDFGQQAEDVASALVALGWERSGRG